MNFSNAIQTAKFAIGRGGVILKKYSPEILTAAGVSARSVRLFLPARLP